jgi:hypothetical protein
MLGRLGADAVQRLAVRRVGLAPDVVGDARFGQQVAFVGRIYEHLPAIHRAVLRGETGDAPARLLHRGEALAGLHRHLHLGQPVRVNGGGDVRLKGPHRGVRAGEFARCRLTATAPAEIVLGRLVLPRGGLGVVQGDAVIELAGQPADGRLVANVRGTQSARGQAADMGAGFHERHGLAQLDRLDGRDDARRSAAEDDDVRLDRRLGRQGGYRRKCGNGSKGHGRQPTRQGLLKRGHGMRKDEVRTAEV